ncbi:hypothetical protein [Sulfuricurvum sp.]|uniref:hypothetical protein n=1 Tax=Sulfuricurvum sp. TaxID=2025608 RepID=UPI003567649F
MIKLAFYKDTKSIWSKLICAWTGVFNQNVGSYSHCEIGFFLQGRWVWYSSASRNSDGSTGTRWIEDEDLFSHPDRWDVFDVKPIRSIEDMVHTCEEECGKKYDWLGIFGFATIFGQINAKKKWYCSEICNYVFFGKWKKRISPKGLFKKIKPYIV